MKKVMSIASLLCIGAFVCLATGSTPAKRTGEVAITIDDLPAHGNLPPGVTRLEIATRMITALKAKGVPAVYGFVNAQRAEGDATQNEVLREWTASGNLLGSHTAAHIDLNSNTPQQFEENIAANEPTLRALMGPKDWHWFRYPFLHEGETLEKRRAIRSYLHDHGYRTAQVTLDFEDYAWNNPYARCMEAHDQKSIAWLKSSYLSAADEYISLDEKLSNLDFGRNINHVLLLHIGAFDSIMLPDLLDLLAKKGYRFVTLGEAESDPAYQSDPDAALPFGGTFLEQLVEGKHLKYPPHAPKPMEKLKAICK